MLKSVFAFCPVIVLLPLLYQAVPAPATIPAEAVTMANPVKATPESVAKAKKMFAMDCAMCHGANGNAKGELSGDFHVKDFTDPASLKDRTDGELFYIVKHGMGKMPPEGDRATADQVWNLVVLVRSFSAKADAKK